MAQFNDFVILYVWNRAKTVSGYDPNIWRKDYAGAWIRRDLYGTESQYGWEIDHLFPISQGGDDRLDNLCPLHWRNNRTKAGNYPLFETSISSIGTQNIEKQQSWTVKK